MAHGLENPENKTIVIIDDDDNICAFLYFLLTKEGFKCVPFKNPEEAMKKLMGKFYHIDLIILDLMMPNRGGYDILKELQGTDYRKVPIFVITARTLDQGTINMIRAESNVEDFFPKPIDPSDFRRRIHIFLKTQPEEQADPGIDWR